MLRAALHIALYLPLFVTLASAQPHKHRINGQCGLTNGVATTTTPSSGLCSAGTASTVSGTGPWTWSYIGTGGGTTAQYSAPLAQNPPVNGQCGPANGVQTSSAPTAGLCSAGSLTMVTSNGPWNWSCIGRNRGSTDSASAPVIGTGGSIIRSDRNFILEPWNDVQGWNS
jgi:hypothetical protein